MNCHACGASHSSESAACSQCGADLTRTDLPPSSKKKPVRITIPLILCVVFGILALVIIPEGKRTVDLARKLVCSVSLKGLGNAITVYCNDYDGRFPTPDSWNELLIRYVDVSPKSFQCPSDESSAGVSLAMNEALKGLNLTWVPGDTVLLFESDLGPNSAGGSADVVFRHQEDGQRGANILLVDGTMKFVQEEAIGDLRWTLEGDEIP